jgi:hypothetical protein
VAKEVGLSVYDVIRYQHECWEEITEPFLLSNMADEEKVKKRIQVKMDKDRKAGVVKKEDGQLKEKDNMEKQLRDMWKVVLSLGVVFYTKKKGWVGDLAREVWERLSKVDFMERKKILAEYTVDRVVERWKTEGCPLPLLEI